MSWVEIQNFSIPVEKEVTNIDKDGNESVVTISYKIKFIDCARFIGNSLSNLVDNLGDRIHEINIKYCDCFLKYERINDMLILQ